MGIDGSVGTRNAPPVINLAWARDFFWAGRAKILEDQARGPVPNPIEMNLPWDQALAKLAAHPEYPAMFGRAFGDEEITEDFELSTPNWLSFYKQDDRYARETLLGDLEKLSPSAAVGGGGAPRP